MKTVKMYKASFGIYDIEIVHVEKETDKNVFINGRRVSKDCQYHKVCNTKEEAFSAIRGHAAKRVNEQISKLEYYLEKKLKAEELIKSWQR